jgi:hypothetical protein
MSTTTTTTFWQVMDTWTISADVRPSLTTRALVRPATYFQTLYDANLLCYWCEERPWTQQARWYPGLLCTGCAEGEPEPERA